jgi:hypothetical protein
MGLVGKQRLSRRRRSAAFAFVTACSVVACSAQFSSQSASQDGGAVGMLADGGSCSVGSVGCACTSGGSCDNGLTCKSARCVTSTGGGTMTDGGMQGTGTDAGTTPMDAGVSTKPFCASQPNPIFCADFDQPNALSAFTSNTTGNGKLTIANTFLGGSAPSALNASVGSGAQATVQTPTITMKANGGTVVDVSMVANVQLPTSGTVKFLSFVFASGDTAELTIDMNGEITVAITVHYMGQAIPASTMLTGIAAGEHSFRSNITIGSGSTTLVCYIDNKPYTPPSLPLAEPNKFTFTLGASGSSTSYSIDYDNVLAQ